MTGSCASIEGGSGPERPQGRVFCLPQLFPVTLTVKLILKGWGGLIWCAVHQHRNIEFHHSHNWGHSTHYWWIIKLLRRVYINFEFRTKKTNSQGFMSNRMSFWSFRLFASHCEPQQFFNSCRRWERGEEFFFPNLCAAYIPTQAAVHITTYFTSNSHTFPDKHFFWTH